MSLSGSAFRGSSRKNRKFVFNIRHPRMFVGQWIDITMNELKSAGWKEIRRKDYNLIGDEETISERREVDLQKGRTIFTLYFEKAGRGPNDFKLTGYSERNL